MEKGGLRRKKNSVENGQKDETERVTGRVSRATAEIEMWDQIPDRGETSEIPSLPSGESGGV